MDDKKKLAALIGLIVVALGAVGFMMTKGPGADEKPREVGSLEENVNKETGLPLNPPKNDVGGTPPPATGGQEGGSSDPSLPPGN